MDESIDLFFGMTGDGVVTSRINAMTRSFKGLERGYRTTSQLGKLANMGSKAVQAGSAIGAGRGLVNLLTPENLSLLSRYIVRPIKLDMRKLTRVIKPSFTKITDTISELSKKVFSKISETALLSKGWIKREIARTTIGAKGAALAGYIGGKFSSAKYIATKSIQNPSMIPMYASVFATIRRQRLESKLKLNKLDKFNIWTYRQIERIGMSLSLIHIPRLKFLLKNPLSSFAKGVGRSAGFLQKNLRLYTGFGKVGEGFRERPLIHIPRPKFLLKNPLSSFAKGVGRSVGFLQKNLRLYTGFGKVGEGFREKPLIHIPRPKLLLKNPLSSFAKGVGRSVGFLQKNLRLYTGFGKVGEGFRERPEVDANKLKNGIFRAYITNKRLLNFVGKKISSGISKSAGFLQKNLRLYTGFGKVGEGFREKLEVDANKLKNGIFRAYITNKRLLNFVGKKISSGISKSVGFLQKNLRLYTGFGKVGEGFREKLEVDANKLKNGIFRAYITNKRLLNFVGKKISSGISKSVGFLQKNLRLYTGFGKVKVGEGFRERLEVDANKLKNDIFRAYVTNKRLLNFVGKKISSGISKSVGFLQKNLRLYTGFGKVKVGEGFRERLEVDANKLKNDIFRAYITNKRLLNFVGKKISSGISKSVGFIKGFLTNPWVLLASAIGLFFAATDRRLGAWLEKAISKVSSVIGKGISTTIRYNQIAIQSVSYMIKRGLEKMGLGFITPESKYSAPDVTQEIMAEMKKQNIVSPTNIREYIDEALRLYKDKFETNLDGYKKNLIDALNKQTEQRLKSIDDLLFTQYRESRL